MSQTAQRQDVRRELGAGDEKTGISAAVDGNVDLNVRDEGVEVSIVEKGGGRRVHRSWVFRMNEVIANWYGMQLGILNTFSGLIPQIACVHLHLPTKSPPIPPKKKTTYPKTAPSSAQSVN
jgi:hypothetical protein